MSDEKAAKRIDRLTVIAIAAIAYAVANFTHEIIGHCGMAMVVGTKCTVISSTYIPLDTFQQGWKYNLIVVAGVTANFAVGLVCLWLLRKLEVRRQEAEGSKQKAEGRQLRTEKTEGSRQKAEGSRQKAEGSKQEAEGRQLRTEDSGLRTEKTEGSKQEADGGRQEATVRYFLWLLMAVNLFLASTYIAVAPIIKFGDSYILIQDLPGQIFWRPAVALAGAIAWWLSFRVCRIELARLIVAGGREARAIAWQLVVPAYLTGGVLMVASAVFSRLDWKIAQLEAAGGSFGLTIWLLILPFFLPQIETPAREPLSIPRSVGWIIAGALTALIFIGVLGRGIGV